MGFLKSSGVRVSADVFSGFNKSASRNEDNKEVRKLFQEYMENHIPKVCKELDELASDAEMDEDEDMLIDKLRETINCRHFGHVYEHLKHEFAKKAVLRQMITRAVKSMCRDHEHPAVFLSALNDVAIYGEMTSKFEGLKCALESMNELMQSDKNLIKRVRDAVGIEEPVLKHISALKVLNVNTKDMLLRGETIPRDGEKRKAIEKSFR